MTKIPHRYSVNLYIPLLPQSCSPSPFCPLLLSSRNFSFSLFPISYSRAGPYLRLDFDLD